MPEVEKTTGGRVCVRGAGRFTRGDRAEVDEEMAAYLCEERGDFELVDEDDGDNSPGSEEDDGDEDKAADEEDGAFHVGEFLDRTPVEDVADDVLAGDVDEHLEEIAEEATRTTVLDAIGERRAELEAEV